jgi:tetratricopeptide (TPR) repeat protein
MELKAPDFRKREDKLSGWLDGEVRTFLFDSFSDDYCTRTGMEFLRGVDIPIKPGDLAAFRGEGGLPVTDLADNMALVIGANTQFRHRDAYIAYLALYFNEKLVTVLAQKGADELKAQHYRRSCIYFRAALLLDDQSKEAMFGYACCCREWYLSMEGEDQQELIAILKKESSEYFEHLTRVYPDDAAAYYFLGYVYVNAGQYKKAELAWKKFIGLSGEAAEERDEIKEIRERLESLKDPVKIEEGVNLLTAGHLEDGLRILERYVGTDYDSWWPLHYYLGSAYRELGFFTEAIEGFKRVLALQPSHEESCECLAELYMAEGDAENAEKYRRKAEIIRRNAQE